MPIERGEVIGLNGTNGPPAQRRLQALRITDERHLAARHPRDPGLRPRRGDRRARRGRRADQRRVHEPHQAAGHAREAHAQDGRRAAPASSRRRSSAPADADVTLVGWGSTEGVIREAMRAAAPTQGIAANNLQVKWLVPLHADAILAIARPRADVIIVENNYSGQFARYLRSETGIVADGHIRKYDGEPFMPHHIVDGVKAILAGTTTHVRARARDHGVRRRAHGDSHRLRPAGAAIAQDASDALTVKDLKGKVDPDWCPGCGDFGVLAALKQAHRRAGPPAPRGHDVSGIGCSSNLPGYINTYGMHTLHGRALAVATGAQLANHDLKVVVTGGDGDGYGIGGNHFIHAMRRNIDLTYIVMDNQIYGLTTGQLSPTSIKGMKTKSTPFGSVENPINPIPLAIAAGATYVARGFTGQSKHLVELIKGGHPAQGLRPDRRLQPLRDLQPRQHATTSSSSAPTSWRTTGHDPTDFHAAMEQGYLWGDGIPIGLFWKRDDLPALDQLEPVLDRRRAAGAPAAGHRSRDSALVDPRADVVGRTC